MRLYPGQYLFSENDAKERPQGFNEFFVSQIGAADRDNARRLNGLGLVAAAQ